MTASLRRGRTPEGLPRRLRVVRAASAPPPEVASRGSGLTRGPNEGERRSLTTGALFVNGRGLTSGWGMVNGTGMIREPVHEVRIARFNGSGATRSAVLTSRDGMTNGSGLTGTTGMTPEAGMTNGSGLTHGHGMTNGDGLVRPPSLPPVVNEVPPRRRGIVRHLLGL